MTAENKKAVINVSRSVPILTSQQVPIGATPSSGVNQSIVGTQTVEYKDAGIILTVTPRIGEQGTVALDVKQEVNDVGAPTQPTGSPEFLKREAETSVVLLNNQTLVLGGLIQNRRSVTKVGIPFLYSIPVFGYLFGSTTGAGPEDGADPADHASRGRHGDRCGARHRPDAEPDAGAPGLDQGEAVPLPVVQAARPQAVAGGEGSDFGRG